MSQYKTFSFDQYEFDEATKTLSFNYSIDQKLKFVEKYIFDLEIDKSLDRKILDRACKIAFLVTGVSYFKTYLPTEITYKNLEVDKNLADFLSKTYQKGLGEFFYVNDLDPATPIHFPSNSQAPDLLTQTSTGALVGIGGGKDSIVSAEKLRKHDISTWSIRHNTEQLKPLIEKLNIKNYSVERKIDPKLSDNSLVGAYNGHVPLSAIFASIGVVLAVLTNNRDVIVSNESSANEPTLTYRGAEINHQYSKSLEFEQDFQKILKQNFGDSIRYFSYLRNLSELQICEMFEQYYDKYSDVFSSCNKAFTQSSSKLFWCSICPKCAFIYLGLANYINEDKLMNLFGGKNLLLDPQLEQTYKMLLGMDTSKPLECVGTVDECRWAMSNLKNKHSELVSKFEVENKYNHNARSEHAIPADYELL